MHKCDLPILELLKEREMYSTEIISHLALKHHGMISAYYSLRKLTKKGFIIKRNTSAYLDERSQRVPRVFYSINPEWKFEDIVKNISNETTHCDYETFKQAMLKYIDDNQDELLRLGDIETYIRNEIHPEISNDNIRIFMSQLVKEEILVYIGHVKDYELRNINICYISSKNKINVERIPTIKDIYEKRIIQTLMDKKMPWTEFKETMFDKYGISRAKFNKAYGNLERKKYILRDEDGKLYLNDRWNYKKGLEMMYNFASKGRKIRCKADWLS